MGKSLGNFITLKDAFTRWSPPVIRFFILQSHYRSTLDFSAAAVEGAAKGWEKLKNTVQNVREAIASETPGQPAGIDLERYRDAFLEAMNDDFNTPQAVGILFDLSREVNQALGRGTPVDIGDLQRIKEFYEKHAGEVLGLAIAGGAPGTAGKNLEPELMGLLISLRSDLRRDKLWAFSDRIRDGLLNAGITLEDKKEGTTWKKISTDQ
jgi:cysteinyl-tRNA synthetase